MNVTAADVTRVVDREGLTCCEVEVQTDSAETPKLLVFFSESRSHDLDMVAVLENDADHDIDWYDNSLHEAYQDVSNELFIEAATMMTDWGTRELFKEQVLSYPGIREEIHDRLNRSRFQL